MIRRDLLKYAALTVPAFATRRFGLASEPMALPASANELAEWRTYQLTTRVRVLKPMGETKLWLPQPLAQDTSFQRTLSSSVSSGDARTFWHEEPLSGLKMLCATFPAGTTPGITMTQCIATRDWTVDVDSSIGSKSRQNRPDPTHAAEFLKATRYVPTDGIIKQTADRITASAQTDVEKTRAIYDWVVNNAHRNPTVRGCGVGDIRPMLETGDLSGKCADLNGLFVGLVKASAIPARDVYGIRVGKTALQCSSLGVSSDDVSKAQHCRAEVYLKDFGWVPMDPADVLKVQLQESPGDLSLSDLRVQSVRQRLFGSWEMNWIAYNYAQDVSLPGSSGPKLHFFMYPQAETADGRCDSLDPQSFEYEIHSRELTNELD